MDIYNKVHLGSNNHKTYDSVNQARKYPVIHLDYKMDSNQSNMEGVSSSYTSSSMLNNGTSEYVGYPSSKPFINTAYKRTDGAVGAHPTSDRDAVITALLNLQDRLKKMELDRTEAEQDLRSLNSETEQYKNILQSGKQDRRIWSYQDKQRSRMGSGDVSFYEAKELDGQLSSAERRIHLLENQLKHMRRLVDNSERKHRGLREQVGKEQMKGTLDGGDVQVQLDRLNELERDQSRLTATQTIAESKIRELERRVKEEKMHRQDVQEKAAQLEKDSETIPSHQTLPSGHHTAGRQHLTAGRQHPTAGRQLQTAERQHLMQVLKTKKPPKKKKKKKGLQLKHPISSCGSEPIKHYRLNLAEIPFVAGKSTTPSHSLGANVQKVLAMMKAHNPALCSQAYANIEGQGSESSTSIGSSIDHDLGELLTQLEDELGHLSSKHQEILEQVPLARDIRMKEQLEQELDVLVENMENKSQQIAKIKQHRKKIENAIRGRSSSAKRSERLKEPAETSTRLHNHHTHHHHYNNDFMNRNCRPKSPHNCHKPIGNSALGKPALFMLRDMKKLQSTLRRDDVC